MTKKEAIKKLQKQKAEYLEEWVDYSGVAEALDMAIEALRNEINCVKCVHYTEKETYTGIKGVCKMDKAHREDLISRADALAEFKDGRDVYDIMESIEELPSAETPTVSEKHQFSEETPTNASTDLISRADAIDAIARDIPFITFTEDPKRTAQRIIGTVPSADRPQVEWKPKNHHTDYCSNAVERREDGEV